MPVVGLSGPRCSASAATSSVNFCFSFTTRSRPLCSHSRWRLSLDVVTWSDATKIGLQHRPNARYPAPFWPWSTRKDHKPNSAIISEGAIWNIWRARGCIHVEETRVPWQLAARAQQSAKIPRIGIIDDSPIWNAFRHRLRDLGYLEGQNIAFDYRYAGGLPDRLALVA